MKGFYVVIVNLCLIDVRIEWDVSFVLVGCIWILVYFMFGLLCLDFRFIIFNESRWVIWIIIFIG